MSTQFRWSVCALLCCATAGVRPLHAQGLTLEAARARALAVSPALGAARAAVATAAGWERQAAAFPNPTISLSQEESNAGGLTSTQRIGLIEQPVAFTGVRGARADAARARRRAAEAELAVAEAALRLEVTRAFAAAIAADRRALRTAEAAAVFERVRRISGERLRLGEVSRYADRRIALETARYAALRAEAQRARSEARTRLSGLLVAGPEAFWSPEGELATPTVAAPRTRSADSLLALALQHRPEVAAAVAELEASAATARAARREVLPVPVLGAGFKQESLDGGASEGSGLVLQLSFGLPLWDRNRGAIQAYSAEERGRAARSEAMRVQVAREVRVATAGFTAMAAQVDAIRPHLGSEATAALGAAEAAFAEGEISLLELLDAVRAYHEAETTFAALESEHLIQLAALERAVGIPLN